MVPPARFEASKLKVDFTVGESDNYSGIIPRTYILSHCDFTANLTLTISNVISLDQVYTFSLQIFFTSPVSATEQTQSRGFSSEFSLNVTLRHFQHLLKTFNC